MATSPNAFLLGATIAGAIGRVALFAIAASIAASLAIVDARAETIYVGTPANYRRYLPLLAPGDTLLLGAGEYRSSLPIHRMQGSAGRPITITGPSAGRPAVLVGRTGSNTISIIDSAYVVVRNLTLEGGNLPIDAVKAEGYAHWAHDITIENLLMRGYANDQQHVGISTKCPAWNWVIRGNTIEGAGTGMYLGNSDGRAPFVGGLIERNLIVNTIGYNLQIKHQKPRPEIEGMPSASSTTIIRHNVFVKSEGGTREAARPSVLVGHFPLEGAGVDDQYVVYGNFFYNNRYEALFQGEGNVALYANIFINGYGDAVRIQPHNDVPRRIDIAYNTVLAEGTGISVMQKVGQPARHLSVVANAVFAGAPIVGAAGPANVTARLPEAERHLRRPFAAPGLLDLVPLRAWSNGHGVEAPNPRAFPDWDKDFDAVTRNADSIGAYAITGAAPRWLPRIALKPK